MPDPSPLSHVLNTSWVLVASALVFAMQAGSSVFALGLVRTKNTTGVALEKLGDGAVAALAFFFVGFALMFGQTLSGWAGTSFFGLSGATTAEAEGGATALGWAFVVFQVALCGVAVTIVSGAMAERTSVKAYLAFATILGAIIYPVFGHWAWGGAFLGAGNEGWLQKLGYHDFAGASVVHGVGAWAALVGVWCVGPRLGRYAADGSVVRMESHGLGWSALGTSMLWVCWWGLTGGRTLQAGSDAALVVFNTNLAAAAAGVGGFLHAVYVQKRVAVEEKVMGAILGGLVAISASCDIVSPLGAVLVGVVAGVVHNVAYALVLHRWRLDDVVGAIPVHGFCGVWGCLAVALVGNLPPGVGRIEQLMIQTIGVLSCFAWVSLTSLAAFKALRAVVGLRVDAIQEIHGVALSHRGEHLVTEEEDGAHELDDDVELSDFLADVRSHVRDEARLGDD